MYFIDGIFADDTLIIVIFSDHLVGIYQKIFVRAMYRVTWIYYYNVINSHCYILQVKVKRKEIRYGQEKNINH